MAQEQAALSLPMELIKPAIDVHVKAAIAQALGKSDEIITKMVNSLMQQQVDSEGKPSSSSYGERQTWLDWAVGNAVRTVVNETLIKSIAEQEAKIREAIEAEMRKSKSPLIQTLISSMASGIAKTLESGYRIEVNFKR